MKHACSILVVLFGALVARAQQSIAPNTGKGRIMGRVLDSALHSGIEYATVTVFQQKSTRPVNGAAVNSKGAFALEGLPAGTYTITIDFIGYAPRSIGPFTLG